MTDREIQVKHGLADHYTAQQTISRLRWSLQIAEARNDDQARRIMELEERLADAQILRSAA